MEYSSNSDISKYSECINRSAGQRSTMTACTDSQKRFAKKDQSENDSEEINQQNICNKRSEKLNKPCENGFCYCFTSDSDQHIRKRKPKMKSRKHCLESLTTSKCSEENTMESSDYSELNFLKNSECNDHILPKEYGTKNKQYGHKSHSVSRNYQLTAKTRLDQNKNAPLIHIVQEIHKDGIVSEVIINKQKLLNRNSPKKIKEYKEKPVGEFEYFTEKTLKEIVCDTESESKTCKKASSKKKDVESEVNQKHHCSTKSKNSRAGQLLKRRVSDNFQSEPKCFTPPKKPPRRFSETTAKFSARPVRPVTNFKDAEIILNKFLKQHGYKSEENEHKSRKTFPLGKMDFKPEQMKPIKISPSCPSFIELENEIDCDEPNIEWVSEEVSKMLTYDQSENGKKNFASLKSEPNPQMGWIIPPKEDIDTVDGVIRHRRETDNFHNFAKNMDSKSTPIKSGEFINAEQTKGNDNSYVTPENRSKTDLSTNLSLKAKDCTCDFIKNSAQKFVNLVSKISSKDKLHNKSPTKNVSCQTSDLNFTNSLTNNTSNNKKARFSLQSPPGSYFSSSPKKTNDIAEFDFNRKLDSPKHDKISQRRLTFSPKKIIKNFSYRSNNINTSQKPRNSEFYKSYQSEFKGDFSLNLMNDILLNIKAKLEANDKYTSEVFQQVERNDEARKSYARDIFHHQKSAEQLSDVNCTTEKIPAIVDIHNFRQESTDQNEIYSEIEEEKIIIKGSSSIRSLNEISHFYANNDPNSEYAEIRRISKTKFIEDNVQDTTHNFDYDYDYEPNYADIEKMHIDDGGIYESIRLGSSESEPNSNYFVQNRCVANTKDNQNYAGDVTQNHDMNLVLKNQATKPVKIVKANYIIPGKTIKQLYKNQLDCSESSINMLGNVCNSIKVAEGCIVEDEMKTVKELVDYFEGSHCQNNTCNQNQSVSYESPNDSFSSQNNEMLTTFQEVLGCDQEDDFDEISDNVIRSKSCPLPDKNSSNRKSSIGNQSCLTYTSNDYKTKSSIPKKKSVRYHLLKHQFRKSFKKGKSFFKKTIQNNSLNDTFNSTTSSYDAWEQSNLGINSLFAEDFDDDSWQKQLEKAVFICRKLPVLESSMEAVEAERLLLYSKLKNEKYKNWFNGKNTSLHKPCTDDESWIKIEKFELPIQNDIEFSDFFNFFYVGVFSDGQKIISTNYAEKHDKLIIFRNCNIVFDNITPNTKIKCDLYVLRLRKVLNTKITKDQMKSKMEEISLRTDTNEQLLSRFKLQGSFQLFPQNFTPFILDETCDRKFKNTNKFCLHSRKSNINLPIDIDEENSLLLNYANVIGKLEVIFDKFALEGFLNIRSISSEHNWNKRWCKIDNFQLSYWDYPQDSNNKMPIFTCNLYECINEKIEIAKQEICPRPKSFYLSLKNNISNDIIQIYFSADNQNDLNYWLNGLNNILDFKKTWM